MTVGPICNVAPANTTPSDADKIVFHMMFLVEDHPNNDHLSKHLISAGMVYSLTKLWAGQLQAEVVELTDMSVFPTVSIRPKTKRVGG